METVIIRRHGYYDDVAGYPRDVEFDGKVKSPYLDPKALHAFLYFTALQMASKILHKLF